jgi:hypothetical protein
MNPQPRSIPVKIARMTNLRLNPDRDFGLETSIKAAASMNLLARKE